MAIIVGSLLGIDNKGFGAKTQWCLMGYILTLSANFVKRFLGGEIGACAVWG